MSNQGTIRLKVTNGAPAIEKLWNGRFKLEFFCDNNTPKEDWYYENVSALLPDYGILQTTNFGSGVSEDWEAIPSSVYPDMRLVLAEYPYNVRAGKHYVKLTYETLTASWVEEKDEDTDYELNGLKRVSRTFVALPDTTYDKVVGTSTIDSNGTTLYLGSFKIEKTDAKWSLTEVWLEAGTLSETLDNVGSQKARVIETVGTDPDTPDGYSLASKQESNFEGFQTNRFTFLEDNVVLSESKDKVGSQLAITQEVFNGTPTAPSGYSIANTQESDVDGIPTRRFTFLKNNVVLSQSQDIVGSQLAIVTEVFNGTPTVPSGYLLANTQKSDVEGIPTRRYTFLKPSVLSQSEDNVGSQKAKVIETFSKTPDTPGGYSLASTQVSDFGGIKTSRYTFLKDNVKLSESEDKVGSQLAKVQEWFNPTQEPEIELYVIGSVQVSDVDGIPTKRYTFLKDNILLSESEDKVGSQLAKVQEWFNPEDEPTIENYIIANTQESDIGGIPTKRFTFLKENVELSRSEDLVGSQLAIVTEVFNPTDDPTEAEYSLARTEVSDVVGIPTKRYTFLKDNVRLSETEDKVGSQLAKVEEWFNPTNEPEILEYVIANIQISDVDGIPTKRFTFLKPSILSLQQDFVDGATTIQVSAFGMTKEEVNNDLSEVTPSHVLIGQSEGDYEGIPTRQLTYEVDDFEVKSQAEDGMEIIVRTELSTTAFPVGVIGVDKYKTRFLTQENIDNGNTIKKRISRYSEAGVLSITPLEEESFSSAPSYLYVTTGAPASSMDGPTLLRPNGTPIGTAVTWFDPKVQNAEGFSTYTQQVLCAELLGGDVQVHSAQKFFTITDPGEMSTEGSFNSEEKSGAATRYPKANRQPRTYRKKATVEVFLTTSSFITETEIAYTERDTDWCSIAFDSFYTNERESTASVSSSWRSFPQYLNSSTTSDTSNASTLGEYYAEANSYGEGALTYTKTGIYRVELEKYARNINGTQLYLKTIVTF